MQFTNQRTIYQQKFVDHWSAAISSCQGDSKALWSRLRPLLVPGTVATSQLTANDFTNKIERIRALTATARLPTIEDRYVLELLSDFRRAMADDVVVILNKSAAKQCQFDPVPSWLVKRTSGILAPIIAHV